MHTASGARTAIVGAGLMGRWHADSLARLGITVTAVVDPDERRAHQLAARCPAARVYPELEAVLEHGAADVVHICTPRALHAAQIRNALEAGCHVLAEKPLADDAAVTGELLELAAAVGRVLCPVHQFPFQAGALQVRRALDRLGTIRHADFTACSAGAAGRSAAERARIAADILPHPLALLACLLPEPIEALDWHAAIPAPGELRASGAGRHVTASILVSMAGRPTRNALRLIGERGTAHLDLFHGFAVIEPGDVSRARKLLQPLAFAARSGAAASANLAARAVHREPAYPGLRELVGRFHLAAAGEAPSPIPPAEVQAVAAVRDRLLGTGAGAESRRDAAAESRPGADPAKYYHGIRNAPGSSDAPGNRPGSNGAPGNRAESNGLQPGKPPTECAGSAAS